MRGLIRVFPLAGILLFATAGSFAKPVPSPAGDRNSLVIIFKDGHRQSLAVAEIARIDFKAPAVIVYKDGHKEKVAGGEILRIEFEDSGLSAMTPGRGHFAGKWEVGDGNGSKFFITLDADGEARKTLGTKPARTKCWLCCSWIWTTSDGSIERWVTAQGTSFYARLRTGSNGYCRHMAQTPWPGGWVETSSAFCLAHHSLTSGFWKQPEHW